MNQPSPPAVTQAYIERQPVVDRKGEIFGYELIHHVPANDEANLASSAAVLAHLLGNLDAGWLPEGRRVFMETDLSLLDDEDFLALLPCGRVVLDLTGAADAVNETVLATCDRLRGLDVGLCIRSWALAANSPELLIRANFVKFDVSGEESYDLYDHLTHLKRFPARKIGRGVADGKHYKFCHDMGFDYFQGYFFTRPEIAPAKEGSPAMALLVQLFDLVGANAEPPQIEAVLKRDPGLVLKLLGFINSAGMGVGRKVTSIQQAIVLLGYKQLYRWVALLLYTAQGGDATPPALMRTVLARSRFIELAGQHCLPRHEQDNLFMVGMLSLLDVAFGVPLSTALAKLPIPARITRAVLEREGPQGQLLMLAEAAEQGQTAMVASLAGTLGLELQDINRFQFESMGWAESLALR